MVAGSTSRLTARCSTPRLRPPQTPGTAPDTSRCKAQRPACRAGRGWSTHPAWPPLAPSHTQSPLVATPPAAKALTRNRSWRQRPPAHRAQYGHHAFGPLTEGVDVRDLPQRCVHPIHSSRLEWQRSDGGHELRSHWSGWRRRDRVARRSGNGRLPPSAAGRPTRPGHAARRGRRRDRGAVRIRPRRWAHPAALGGRAHQRHPGQCDPGAPPRARDRAGDGPVAAVADARERDRPHQGRPDRQRGSAPTIWLAAATGKSRRFASQARSCAAGSANEHSAAGATRPALRPSCRRRLRAVSMWIRSMGSSRSPRPTPSSRTRRSSAQ